MKVSYLKIASVVSALIVFFPSSSGILLPFAFSLAGYKFYSGWRAFVIPTVVWVSLIYLIYSAIKNYQSKTDSIISLFPLLAFLILLATHIIEFINYSNWLSLATGILSVIVISTTILMLSKQLRSPYNE